MVNGVIDQSYKIINPVTNVQNLPPEAEVDLFLRFQTVTNLIFNPPYLIHHKSQLHY